MNSVGQSFGSIPLTIRFPLLEALQDGSSRLGLAGWTVDCGDTGLWITGNVMCKSVSVSDKLSGNLSGTAVLSSLVMPEAFTSAYLCNVYVGFFDGPTNQNPGYGSIHVAGMSAVEGWTSDIVFEKYVKVYSQSCMDGYKSFQLDCTDLAKAKIDVSHGVITTKDSTMSFNDAVTITDDCITIASKRDTENNILACPKIYITDARLTIKGGDPYDDTAKTFLYVADNSGSEVAFTFSDFQKLKALISS